MASLWQKTMLYLGLQDDGHDYSAPATPSSRGSRQSQFSDQSGYERRSEFDNGRGEETDDYYNDEDGPYSDSYRGGIRTVRPNQEQVAESSVRTVNPTDQPSGVSANRSAVARPASSAPGKVHIVDPRSFNDAQEVGDRLKSNQAVIINLQGTPKDLQRRLIDFTSGLAYAVGGSMSRVADAVFLISPTDVELSEAEKERLEARGLYRRD